MTIQQLFGIELPIIQAPMAGVQGSALAIAVSNAGGLGSLPCAMLSVDAMRKELSLMREQTSKPYNVNFFCHEEPVADPARDARYRQLLAPYYREFGLDADAVTAGAARRPFDDAAADVLAEYRPAVVSFHFGLPNERLLARVRECGAKILSSATTVEEALWLEAHGVDAVIAQGTEAGGHRGMFLTSDIHTQIGTMALLPQILDKVRLPVIAAGGIATATSIKGALAMGAAGVQLGTAYLLCPESTTSAVHRAALAGPHAGTTALTNLYTGRPARGIVNRLMRELGPLSADAPAFPLASSAIAPLRARAEAAMSGDFSPLWCGQDPSGCRQVSAAELTRSLAAGLAATTMS
jgi:nitronate monooxygenase